MWNAHAKDALEERLQYMVCDKQIDLASAQRQIATDWIAAYKKYLHADNPCNAIWCHTTRLLFWSTVRRGDDSGAVIPSVTVRLCKSRLDENDELVQKTKSNLRRKVAS